MKLQQLVTRRGKLAEVGLGSPSPKKRLLQSPACCPTFSLLDKTPKRLRRPSLPCPRGKGSLPLDPLSGFTRGHQSPVRMPLSHPQRAPCSGPGSPAGRLTLQRGGGHGAGTRDAKPGLPRCSARSWTGLLRCGANSISAQLGLDVPAPCLPPPPPPRSLPGHRAGAARGRAGLSRGAREQGRGRCHVEKRALSAVGLSVGHRVSGAQGRHSKCCPLSSAGEVPRNLGRVRIFSRIISRTVWLISLQSHP